MSTVKKKNRVFYFDKFKQLVLKIKIEFTHNTQKI